MRWFWALTVAALVAVAGVRPVEPVFREPDRAAHLAPAHTALPVIARRDRDRLPDLQLPVVAPVAVTEVMPPRVAVVVSLSVRVAVPAVAVVSSRSSRGPPLA
jgi:hypothetical protein